MRIAPFLLVLLFCGPAALPQSPDSLPEVAVYAFALSHYTAGSRVQTLDSTWLRTFGTASLSDLLRLQTPLYFRDYGQGQLSSASFRGTSAAQTNVLWHGFSVNSPTLGGSDFSVLPAAGYDHVELQHGNAASLWGSGSMGGSVLLESRPVFGHGWRADAQVETSRFAPGDFSLRPFGVGYASGRGRVRYGAARLSVAGAAWHVRAQNDFPYRHLTLFGQPVVRQQNAALRQGGATYDLDWKFARNGLFSARFWYTHTYRQVPPSMLETNRGDVRTDVSLRTLLSGRHATRFGETTLRAALFQESLTWNRDRSPLHSLQAQLLHEKLLTARLRLKAGAEWQAFRATVAGNYSRRENRRSVFLLTEYRAWQRLTVVLNLRQAWPGGFRPPFTPHLGAEWVVWKAGNRDFTLKGNAGRAYRVPTLHDRFWQPGGNPALRPETSTGFEAGAAYRLAAGRWRLTAEATAYRNAVSDWIQWVPVAGVWSPRNVAAVRTQGVELSARAARTGVQTQIVFNAQYFGTHAVYRQAPDAAKNGRQLEYTPPHTGLVSGQVRHRAWTAWAVYGFTGRRLGFGLDAAPAPPYALAHLGAGRWLGRGVCRMQVLIKCQNLANVTYQTYGYYPMPGRNYSLSVGWWPDP